ncbi:hypothetical protein TrVE_jg13857 [Triparma verrucosa]|uniref:sphingomyelin phosphodiesterase n=1 Tax=Triparma verrucosa TaxID=1606542 RepID=A0A9W7BS36_9STRA|nr:hypothetical protein TrVE_jg13857 [Triparma verrucosa]
MSSATQTLRVLQYNLFLRPALVSNPSQGDFKDARLEAFIATVLNPGTYDVILLQEVFSGINVTSLCCLPPRRLNKLLAAAASAGYHHNHKGPPASFGTFLDGGLLVLSKFPIIKKSTLTFQCPAAASDSLASKGAIHALLALPDSRLLDVFTSHTQASYEYTASEAIDRVQRKQIEELATFIAASMEDRCCAVFGGDLNIDAQQDSTTGTYTFMMETMKNSSSFDRCEDLLLADEGGAHPDTSVPYSWDTVSGKEVVSGSYLGRSDVSAAIANANPKANAGIVRKAARYDYLLLLSKNRKDSASASLRKSKAEIKKFEQPAACPFMYLSDHFAVAGELEIDE